MKEFARERIAATSATSGYTVERSGGRFKFNRNANGVQVTVVMPDRPNAPEQEKRFKEQIIELIAGKLGWKE